MHLVSGPDITFIQIKIIKPFFRIIKLHQYHKPHQRLPHQEFVYQQAVWSMYLILCSKLCCGHNILCGFPLVTSWQN